MKYKWLFFDADGTLLDYDKAEQYALANTFEQIDVSFNSIFLNEYKRINKSIWQAFEAGGIDVITLKVKRFKLLFDAFGIQYNPEAFSSMYLRNLSKEAHVFEDAEQTLQALYGKYKLLLVTNGPKEVQRARIRKTQLEKYFEGIVISDEINASKPSKTFFEIAFQKIGYPRKEEVLIIGNSLTSDIRGGDNYGIDTCWYNPTRKSKELDIEVKYEINNLLELISLLIA